MRGLRVRRSHRNKFCRCCTWMIEDESSLKYNIDFFSFEQAYKQVSKP